MRSPVPRVFAFAALVINTAAFAAADRDWSVYLGDAGGTHYSALRQIDRQNVSRLVPAWMFHTGDAQKNSQIQCNPLIIDGVLYGSSAQLKLFAVDAANGRERWHFDPIDGGVDVGGGRGLNRGLTFWREGTEQRILFSASHYLHAIDPATGKLIESFGDHGRIDLLEGLDRDASGMF